MTNNTSSRELGEVQRQLAAAIDDYVDNEPFLDGMKIAGAIMEKCGDLFVKKIPAYDGKEADFIKIDEAGKALGGPEHEANVIEQLDEAFKSKVLHKLMESEPKPDANGWYSVEQALPSPGTPWLIFSRPHEEQAVGTLLSAEAQKSSWTDCMVAAFEVGEGSESFVFYATHWRCMVPDPVLK